MAGKGGEHGNLVPKKYNHMKFLREKRIINSKKKIKTLKKGRKNKRPFEKTRKHVQISYSYPVKSPLYMTPNIDQQKDLDKE